MLNYSAFLLFQSIYTQLVPCQTSTVEHFMQKQFGAKIYFHEKTSSMMLVRVPNTLWHVNIKIAFQIHQFSEICALEPYLEPSQIHLMEPFQWRLKRLTITIIPTKGPSIFSVGKICIFLASKSPKPKSNKNFHFSCLLSGRLVSIHRKHQKFKNSFQRYLENPELFYSNFLYGSIYP